MYKYTYTITFGDCGENHVGMQMIGKKAPKGFSYEDLLSVQEKLKELNAECEIIHINNLCLAEIDDSNDFEDAYILIARNVLDIFSSADENFADKMLEEQSMLKYDTKMYSKKHVDANGDNTCNKNARHNILFDNENQIADIKNGKGTIVAYRDVPYLETVKNLLPDLIDSLEPDSLIAEGNYYYDIDKTYISSHGDTERVQVIGLRLGATYPLHFQWYKRPENTNKGVLPIGKRLSISLNHGDIYIMSTKAVGSDWKKKIIPTLRHSAGKPEVLRKTLTKEKRKIYDKIEVVNV